MSPPIVSSLVPNAVPDGVFQAVVALVLALGGGATLLQLFTVRQQKRKIGGEASASEANAASTLSGAAMTIVKQYEKSAAEAKRDAKIAKDELQKVWVQLNEERWNSYQKDLEIDALRSEWRDRFKTDPPAMERKPPPATLASDPPPLLAGPGDPDAEPHATT